MILVCCLGMVWGAGAEAEAFADELAVIQDIMGMEGHGMDSAPGAYGQARMFLVPTWPESLMKSKIEDIAQRLMWMGYTATRQETQHGPAITATRGNRGIAMLAMTARGMISVSFTDGEETPQMRGEATMTVDGVQVTLTYIGKGDPFNLGPEGLVFGYLEKDKVRTLLLILPEGLTGPFLLDSAETPQGFEGVQIAMVVYADVFPEDQSGEMRYAVMFGEAGKDGFVDVSPEGARLRVAVDVVTETRVEGTFAGVLVDQHDVQRTVEIADGRFLIEKK